MFDQAKADFEAGFSKHGHHSEISYLKLWI
jgi:hypothetical protein